MAVMSPLRSISELVTTVVACTTTPLTSAAPMPAFFKTECTPAKKPSSRLRGVVRVLSTTSAPVEARSTMSVKVPPMSTASE